MIILYRFQPPRVPNSKYFRFSVSIFCHFYISQLSDHGLQAFLIPTSLMQQGIPLPLLPSTSDSYILPVLHSLLVLSSFQNDFKTFRSPLSLISSFTPTLRLPSLLLTLCNPFAPHILLTHLDCVASSLAYPNFHTTSSLHLHLQT